MKVKFMLISLIVAVLFGCLLIFVGVPNYVQQLFAVTSPDSITNICYVLMSALFAFSCLNIKNTDKLKPLIESTPTLLTSLGILGTFIGIVIGLLGFDPQNIDNSITVLLGGMKTAFLTSVVGVILSIAFKIIYTLAEPKTEDNNTDILTTFNQQAQQVKLLTDSMVGKDNPNSLISQIQIMNEGINQMIKAIGSDSDNSLLGQLVRLRQNLSDNQKTQQEATNKLVEQSDKTNQLIETNQKHFSQFETNLTNQLTDFAEMLSKAATEQVIDALKGVIQDFNNKLTEQFGENFKQLNIAVGALVKWQDNYKEQLATMIAQYSLGVQAISQTEAAVANIEQATQSIPLTMEDLGEIMAINQRQINNLNEHLHAFAKLKDKAVEAIPVVQQQIETMLDNVSNATKQLSTGLTESSNNLILAVDKNSEKLIESADTIKVNQQQMHTALKDTADNLTEHAKEIHTKLVESSQELTQQTRKWSNEFKTSLDELQQQFITCFTEITTKHTSESNKLLNDFSHNGEQILKNTQNTLGKQVDEQLKRIDDSMQQELARVFNQMGSSLATITGRFTSDYEKLVKAMNDIVNQRGKF